MLFTISFQSSPWQGRSSAQLHINRTEPEIQFNVEQPMNVRENRRSEDYGILAIRFEVRF